MNQPPTRNSPRPPMPMPMPMPPPTPPAPPPAMKRSQGCFRVLLWLAPLGFAAGSAAAVTWLSKSTSLPGSGPSFSLWILFNIAFIVGTGWFNATLSPLAQSDDKRMRKAKITSLTVLFFFIQVAIIPIAAVAAVFAFCALAH